MALPGSGQRVSCRCSPWQWELPGPDAYRPCSAVAAQLYTGPLVLRGRRTRLRFLLGQHPGRPGNCLECLLVCYLPLATAHRALSCAGLPGAAQGPRALILRAVVAVGRKLWEVWGCVRNAVNLSKSELALLLRYRSTCASSRSRWLRPRYKRRPKPAARRASPRHNNNSTSAAGCY